MLSTISFRIDSIRFRKKICVKTYTSCIYPQSGIAYTSGPRTRNIVIYDNVTRHPSKQLFVCVFRENYSYNLKRQRADKNVQSIVGEYNIIPYFLADNPGNNLNICKYSVYGDVNNNKKASRTA